MPTLTSILLALLVVLAQQQSSNNLDNCQIANLATYTCISCKTNYTLINNKCLSNNSTSSASQNTYNYGYSSNSNSQSTQGQTGTQTTQTSNIIYVPVYTTQGSGQISNTGSTYYQGSGSTSNNTGSSQWNSALNNLNSQTSQSSTTSINSGSSTSGPTISIISSSYNDANCKTIDSYQQICSECYPSFYYNPSERKCVVVNPLCKTYTKTNVCLSCYGGYKLSGVTCVIDSTYMTPDSGDLNCKTGSNGYCSECYKGYYFNSTQAKCVAANPLCKTYTNNNLCTSCYPGYSLNIQGNCVMENGVTQSQSTSSQTSSSGQSGQQSQGQSTTSNIYTNTNNQGNSGANNGYSSGSSQSGASTQVLPNGNTLMMFGAYYIEFSAQGQIINIYPLNYQSSQQTTSSSNTHGNQGQSTQSSTQTSQSTSTSSSSIAQTQCYTRQVLKNGQCVNVSDQCQTWDNTTGDCTSCYLGYTSINGICAVTQQ